MTFVEQITTRLTLNFAGCFHSRQWFYQHLLVHRVSCARLLLVHGVGGVPPPQVVARPPPGSRLSLLTALPGQVRLPLVQLSSLPVEGGEVGEPRPVPPLLHVPYFPLGFDRPVLVAVHHCHRVAGHRVAARPPLHLGPLTALRVVRVGLHSLVPLLSLLPEHAIVVTAHLDLSRVCVAGLVLPGYRAVPSLLARVHLGLLVGLLDVEQVQVHWCCAVAEVNVYAVDFLLLFRPI